MSRGASPRTKQVPRAYRGKRVLDLCIAGPALVLLSPLMAAIATVIRLTMGWPVLFRQERPGAHGRPFTLLKFRTMSNSRDNDGKLLPDERRLTRFGRFLRASSLDELPELINVIRGEMSVVGPRPLLLAYLDRYTAEQARRHETRPGITGLAQVRGRNSLSWEEKFKLDVWYVDHQSILLDARIVGVTLWKILKRDGIASPGHATMPEFLGPERTRATDRQ